MKLMHLETQIFFGKDSLKELNLTGKNYVMAVSNSLDKTYLKKIKSYWKKKGISFSEIKKINGEPYSDNIDQVCKELKENIDGFIGIGGGSVMDFIKAVAIIYCNGGSIRDYEFGEREIKTCKPIFLCPTTCGSGSEVTPYTVINNSYTSRKFTLSNKLLFAKQAALDPFFLKQVSQKVRVNTALDAFTHCLESLLNKSSDSLFYPLSYEGLVIAVRNMKSIGAANPSLETLEKASLLSLYGGISISNSRTGLIHTISVAIAKFANIPHGRLNAQILPFALEHNKSNDINILSNLLSYPFDISFKDDNEALKFLKEWILNFIDYSDFPVDCLNSEHKFIVDRVMQDKGLPKVSYGRINHKNISNLLKKMEYEIRQFK